jgi:cytochrome c-type biogenesis protein CcmE
VAVEQSERPGLTSRPGVTPRPRRRKAPWSLVIAGVAIAGAVLYLVLANTGASAEYYMTIRELRACGSCAQRIVRVAGVVAPDSIVKNDQTQVIHFTITENALSMPVVYGGTVPDIFRAGVQVVVEGRLGSAGIFQAQNLLAKCPSKFQSATPPPGQ